ncbi:hypothetical protein Agub_g6983 [Astrephomene gubernaculifera]|uniref:HECT-type E3 ubiquitin transferase n=1 Tax=Astrephomene gubernaculifera TaxID=47775 RepID=A0AAD3HLY9_9CHLO|nr:hypothetical protein Agub_g6983 [Astrephomene gubernaculifera]
MRGLGGSTRKEQTRDELLDAVRSERAARSDARQRNRAAALIQRTWRGHAARRRLRAALVSEWAAEYGPLVAVAAAPGGGSVQGAGPRSLSAEEVAAKLLPPFLFLLKPPRAAAPPAVPPAAPPAAPPAPSATPSAAPAAAAPASPPPPRAPTAATAPSATPTPTATRASPAPSTPAPSAAPSTKTATPLRASPPGDPHGDGRAPGEGGSCCPHLPPALLNMVRGSLALLLRSCAASDPRDSYLALATCGDARQRASWQEQSWRLLLACCRLVAAPAAGGGRPGSTSSGAGGGGVSSGSGCMSDPVVDAAALRLAVLLTDASGWKCLTPGPSPQRSAAHAATAQLRCRLSARPQPLFAALARLLAAQHHQKQEGKQGQGLQQGQGQGGQRAPPAPAPPPPPQQPPQQLSRLLGLVVAVLRSALEGEEQGGQGRDGEQGQGSSSSNGGVAAGAGGRGEGGGGGGKGWRCVAAFAQLVLVAPGAVGAVPEEVQARLRAPDVWVPLCRCVRQLVRSGQLGGAVQAAWCLSNLIQLLLGPCMGPGAGGAGAAGAACRVLAPLSDSLWGPKQVVGASTSTSNTSSRAGAGTAAGTARTAAAAGTGSQGPGRQGAGRQEEEREQEEEAGGGSGSVAGAVAATAAALMRHVMRGVGRPSSPSPSSSLLPDLAAAVGGWWPLGQRGLLEPLLGELESQPGGVEVFADMCCTAMELGPRLNEAFAAEALRADVPSLLNALSFSPACLPRLWRWLCFSLGLPREVPAEAVRGLDVAALAGGVAGVGPAGARVLGLFCRTYSQLLLVLDDGEFYGQQPRPLSLGAARAVGACLNSLVFHTYLPKGSPPSSDPSPGATSHPAYALLSEWAPKLLRELYERDVRRPYCQPILWLAPYLEMFGSGEEEGGGAGTHKKTRCPRRRTGSSGGRPRFLDPESWFGGGGSEGGGAWGQEGGSEPPPPPDPAATRIGPFTTGAVLHWLMYGGSGGGGGGGGGVHEEDDEGVAAATSAGGSAAGGGAAGAAAPALQSRPGEGCRPSSVASLLRVMPQAVPFPRRVDLLRALLAEDRARGRWEQPVSAGGVPPIKVTIHRSSLMEDAYRGLAARGEGIKARLQVKFINESGLEEAGLDFGGLQKELLERVVAAGLDAQYGLFTCTSPEGLAHPNPAAERLEGGLPLLEFLGLMFGKALYEGILLPVPFAHFFIARLQGRAPLFDDLASLDPQLHKNLLMVKRYEGDVSELGLTFAASTDFFGCPTTHELLPGGAEVAVTNDSRLLYCHLLADWHLTGKLGTTAAAFARGLFAVIPQASLRLFNPREFNQLLSGAADSYTTPSSSLSSPSTSLVPRPPGPAPLDVADMRRWTRYSGGYSPESPTVRHFWRVVSELSAGEQAALLRFVTSCSRPPLGGFRYLNPPLTLHQVDCDAGVFAALGGRDVSRLPSASTCYNMLKLPNYRRAATLREKLLYSISSGAGFELS